MKVHEVDLDTFSKVLYKNWAGCKKNDLQSESEHLALALGFLFRDEVCTGNFCTGTHIVIYNQDCLKKEIAGYYILNKEEIKRLRKNNVIKMLLMIEDKKYKNRIETWKLLTKKLYNTLKRRRE